jgi:pimeloyl-ACP methyl ester carboxylesterase
MKSRLAVAVLVACPLLLLNAVQLRAQAGAGVEVAYGNNRDAGHYVVFNGVRIYYEAYGKGEPLILLHGNGGNIAGMKFQIAYFSKHYNVIAMDCRGRGKSELGRDSLTYMQMTRDAAALLSHLQIDSAYVIGRSDGGIIGLLLGIYFPEKVKKIAALGANLWPDTTALYPQEVETNRRERKRAEEMLAQKDTTQNWLLAQQRYRLMEFQPHISGSDLRRIQSPVLVVSCDRDLIQEEHTLFIYRHISRSNLCIFPGETHWITSTNPELFNTTVAKFFSEPFKGEEFRK